jgi:hypothetical protein
MEKPLGNTGLDFHTEVQCDTNIHSIWKGKNEFFHAYAMQAYWWE